MSKLRQARLDEFFAAYEPILTRCVNGEVPAGTYAYGPERVPSVVANMRAAVERADTFKAVNKEGGAIKAVCKQLGIKHTYKAIDEWLSQGAKTRVEEEGDEVNFPTREAALARAVEDGALYTSASNEPKHVTLYRKSKSTPGAFGFCVVFQRSSGETWCRGPWLVAHDGLPASADALNCEAHAEPSPSCLYCCSLARLAGVRS